ncbi:14063_t:CDS:2 [Entrophospora sp. SA101]|nr:14063_t:CDS:2 [Entrophospora sp. SA101]
MPPVPTPARHVVSSYFQGFMQFHNETKFRLAKYANRYGSEQNTLKSQLLSSVNPQPENQLSLLEV